MTTVIRATHEGLVSHKRRQDAGGEVSPLQRQLDEEPLLTGLRLSTLLEKRAFYGETELFYQDFEAFLRWSFDHWHDGQGKMKPEALDAILTNAVLREDGGYDTFDLEWSWPEPIDRSWFVLRNVAAARHAWRMNPSPRYRRLRDMYEAICRDLGVSHDFERDLQQKVEFHAEVGEGTSPDEIQHNFREILEDPRTDLGYAREPEVELTLRTILAALVTANHEMSQELAALRRQNHDLGAELTRKSIRIALAVDRLARKVPFVHPLGRAVVRLIRRR